jgi:DNA-binding NarL/FixJ family response regulator
MMFSILLVDDHKIMRDGLRAILASTGEFKVLAEAESGSEAVHLARQLRPSLVLMDLSLPGLNGIEATIEILRFAPDARIVVLSMYEDEESVVRAIRAGARGFVLKKASHSDLLDALRVVAKGGSYLSPQVSDKLLHRIQSGNLNDRRETNPLDVLTPRESQVMRLIADGKTSKEVAVLLNLGHETVRSYRKALMKKLGVTNVAELTQLALRHKTGALESGNIHFAHTTLEAGG